VRWTRASLVANTVDPVCSFFLALGPRLGVAPYLCCVQHFSPDSTVCGVFTLVGGRIYVLYIYGLALYLLSFTSRGGGLKQKVGLFFEVEFGLENAEIV